MLTRALGDMLGITRSATAPVAFEARGVASWGRGGASVLWEPLCGSGDFAAAGCEDGTAGPSWGAAAESLEGDVGPCGNGEVRLGVVAPCVSVGGTAAADCGAAAGSSTAPGASALGDGLGDCCLGAVWLASGVLRVVNRAATSIPRFRAT